jgi:hypothetical protein
MGWIMATTDAAERDRMARRKARPRGELALPFWLTATLALLAVGYVVHLVWARWPGYTVAPDAPSVPVTVAGLVFNIPPAAIRVPLQRRPGAQERIDLAFLWPSLAPPDPKARPSPSEEPNPLDRLFVTIAAHRGTLTPVERMKTIYPRYTAGGPNVAQAGLAVITFRDGTPYQGEDLYYDLADPEHFVARCNRPGAAATPGQCLYERRLGAADITTRFPRAWLNDWQDVVAGVDRLIANLRPAGG